MLHAIAQFLVDYDYVDFIKRALPTCFLSSFDTWSKLDRAIYPRSADVSSFVLVHLYLSPVRRRFPHVITMRGPAGSPDVVDQRDGLYRTDRPPDLASRHFSLVFSNWITSSWDAIRPRSRGTAVVRWQLGSRDSSEP